MDNLNNHGKAMGELHVRFKSCKEPYLNDQECKDLKEWYKEILEYSDVTGDHINTVYFGMEYESIAKICFERRLK